MGWNNTWTGLTARMHSYWWLTQASDSLWFMCVSNITQKDVMMTELGHPTICPWLRTNSQTHTNISFISKKKKEEATGFLDLFLTHNSEVSEWGSQLCGCVREDWPGYLALALSLLANEADRRLWSFWFGVDSCHYFGELTTSHRFGPFIADSQTLFCFILTA